MVYIIWMRAEINERNGLKSHFPHRKPSKEKWQVIYIAPLNHLPLLPSGPGGVQQELVV